MASAYHKDLPIPESSCFRHGGPIINAGPGEVGQALSLQLPEVDAVRDHHCMSIDLIAVIQHDLLITILLPDLPHIAGQQYFRAQAGRLDDRPAGELRPAEPRREAQVIFDPRTGAPLSAPKMTLHHQALHSLRGALDSNR